MRLMAQRGRFDSPALVGTLAVLRLLPRVSRGRTVLLTAGVFTATALPLATTLATGLLIGSIPSTLHHGLSSIAGRTTLTLLATAGLLIIAQRLLAPLLAALAAVFGREIDQHMQERVIAAVGRPSGVAHLDDPTTLDLVQAAQGIGADSRRPGTAVTALASLLPSWFQALGSALILLPFHWWLALSWIVCWPVITYVFQREYLRTGAVAAGQAHAIRRAEYYRFLALDPGVGKELRLWGALDWLIGRFEGAWVAAMRPIWLARRPTRPAIWVSVSAVALLNLASFGLLALAATRGEISLGALAVYVQAVLTAGSFRAFDDANTDLAYAAVAVPNLLALERRVSGDSPAPRPALAPQHGVPPASPRRSICFEGVTFRYPGQLATTLAGLDLELPAGQSVAIVGANGAGKTTLVKLLCRLYDPDDGRITVDGIDLREVPPREWQRRIAAIFQDFARYHLAARENVALGAYEHRADAVRLQVAARRAGALDVIESLPHGWDTVLSRQYTEGTDLSGGQWQRIALARAFFAVEAGARVLILDEPTASLDVRAEAELYDHFLEMTAGLTTVLISHRFSTVRRAHRIYVLEQGQVAEAGTHDDLMARGGRYAEMFRLQAARFAGEEGDDDDGA